MPSSTKSGKTQSKSSARSETTGTKTSKTAKAVLSTKPVKKISPAVDKPVKKSKAVVAAKPGAVKKEKTTAASLNSSGKSSGSANASGKENSADKAVGKPSSKTSKPVKPTKEKLAVHQKRVKETEKGAATEVFRKVPQKIAQDEIELLCHKYPEADCELDFKTPFQLITSVIMSAQTTDVNVNKVTPELFRKYPDAKALAEAPLDDIKNIIKSTGFFNAKATNIQNCARKLVEKFGGEVPKTIEELVTLPGVGRKTANVVLGVCFGIPGWTVDTHVQRLSKRLGFTNEQDPEKIEYELQKIFSGQDWSKLSITMIWHGRRVCFARKPNCEECPVNHICPSSLMPA